MENLFRVVSTSAILAKISNRAAWSRWTDRLCGLALGTAIATQSINRIKNSSGHFASRQRQGVQGSGGSRRDGHGELVAVLEGVVGNGRYPI